MPLPTLDDLKRHLNKSNATDDAELLDMLDAAIEVVERIVGPITTTPVTETHYDVSSNILLLRQTPVVALSAVASRAGLTLTPLSLADYELDPTTGIVRLVNGTLFCGTYTVTYSAGRPTPPAAIGLAALIIAAHLYETQRVPGTRGAAPGPAFQQLPDPAIPIGYSVPNRARELLEPYVRPGIA